MMAFNGLAKLIEECGELVQACGKKIAYYTTDDHPDGGPPLTHRLEDEIADVLAACEFVMVHFGLNLETIRGRKERKLAMFNAWHRRADNNAHAAKPEE